MSDRKSPETHTVFCLSRRRMLEGAALGGAILMLAATTEPASAKMTEAAAGYQGSPRGDSSCANCTLFRQPSGCLIVDGDISQNGWCRFYSKKS